MKDEIDWHSLSDKDLPLLVEAFKRSMRRDSEGDAIVDRPPVIAIPEDRLRVIVREVSERVFDEKVRPLTERINKFLEGDQIAEMIEDRFAIVGLPVDREHREATGNAVREVMRWQKRIDKVIGGIALAIVTAVFYAMARLVGINLPSTGGHS